MAPTLIFIRRPRGGRKPASRRLVGGFNLSSTGQQHPISLYLKVWGLLFVLSTMSYLVDYFHFQGYLRWSLILFFMLLKAGLIVGVFMHMAWERLAVLVLVGLMAAEAGHTFLTRLFFFR